MKTLDQNQLTSILGGYDWSRGLNDNWDLQLLMDQLAREQEAALLREMMLAQAD